jgi:hypothetical protein
MPNTTYATLADLRTHAGIPATGEDALLQALLNTAAEVVDGYCNTTFVSTTITLEMHDGAGSRWLYLRHRPVISITEIQLVGAAISTDAYELDTDEGCAIIPHYDEDEEGRNPRLWRRSGGDVDGWPTGTRNIGVTYVYGHSTIPDGLSIATCMIAAALYQGGQRRGVTSESLGPRTVAYSAAESIPSVARVMLDKYREYEVRG